jgi:hypothetical protein
MLEKNNPVKWKLEIYIFHHYKNKQVQFDPAKLSYFKKYFRVT